MRLYPILVALSLFSTVHCGTDFRKPPLRDYWKSWGHNYVRLGLGYTLPLSTADSVRKNLKDVFQAMIQVLEDQEDKMSEVSAAFEKNEIPGALNIAPPTIKAEVIYDSGVRAELGNVLTPTLVQNQPTVQWPAEDGALYTLLLTDPDAPSREDPKWGEWRHWLVTNIPGNNIAGGEVQAEYIGSGPPKDTGLHRYIFLVFKQSGRVDYTDEKLGLNTKNRNNTKTTDLVAKYNLGAPVAGNFYMAEYDDYVPKLYEKLSG